MGKKTDDPGATGTPDDGRVIRLVPPVKDEPKKTKKPKIDPEVAYVLKKALKRLRKRRVVDIGVCMTFDDGGYSTSFYIGRGGRAELNLAIDHLKHRILYED